MNEEGESSREIRPSALAGTWYPESKSGLAKMVDEMLAKVPGQDLGGELVGLVVPHAGYMYSGQVAAHAYKLLVGLDFDVVVLIGPSHRTYFPGLLVSNHTHYETPLGLVKVDQDLIHRLADEIPIAWVGQDLEHSLEIQLPFLQRTLQDFTVVPLMMAEQSAELARKLGTSLIELISGRRALVIASSDLSHFHSYEAANDLDSRAVKAIEQFDVQMLLQDIAGGHSEACGYGAIVTLLLTARGLGATTAIKLNYANSGDVTGDKGRVVGYMASAIMKSSAH